MIGYLLIFTLVAIIVQKLIQSIDLLSFRK